MDGPAERKLAGLVEDITTLDASLRGVTRDAFLAWEPLRRFGVRYLLQVIVQGAVDLCQHLLAEAGHAPAEDYFQAVMRAGEKGMISPDLARRLAPAAGLRNALVHEYAAVDDGIVFDSAGKALTIIPEFVAAVRARL